MLRVLIAEDEPVLVLALRAQLASRGFRVVGAATNGREAVCLCRQTNPDVILMDVGMPVMDGVEATRQIMAECPTRVVVLSAWAERDAMAQAMEAGAQSYLMKPASVDDVVRALRAAVRECP